MRRAIPILAGGVMMLGLATPAQATEWIDCGDAANEVNLGFLLGGLDFSQVSGTHLRIGDDWWSDRPSLEPGKPLAIGDFFFDWKLLKATVVDENRENVLAELHVVLTSSETFDAKGGVLTVPGKGAWVVSCEGP
jgi:hypothetical protein